MKIEGLEPGTRYRYRVIVDGAEGKEAVFRTAPAGPEPFRFVVYGDSRSVPKAHLKVVEGPDGKSGILGASPALVLHVGDIVLRGRYYGDWGPQFFEPVKRLAAVVPIYPVLGNHEYSRKLFSHAHMWYYDYFSLPEGPGGGAWYAFSYGAARFIALDTNQDFEAGSPQGDWFRRELASAETRGAAWRFVFFHHPAFSSGNHGGTPAVQKELVPLLERYGIHMVFSGHDHVYDRSYKNRVHYVVTGGGGAPFSAIFKDRNGFSLATARRLHFCTVDLSEDTLRFAARAPDGTVFDSLTLLRPGPLSARRAEDGTLLFSWPPLPEDACEGYNLYRSETPDGPFEKINENPLEGTEFTTAGSSPAGYYVMTYVWEGKESAFSNEIEIRATE